MYYLFWSIEKWCQLFWHLWTNLGETPNSMPIKSTSLKFTIYFDLLKIVVNIVDTSAQTLAWHQILRPLNWFHWNLSSILIHWKVMSIIWHLWTNFGETLNSMPIKSISLKYTICFDLSSISQKMILSEVYHTDI